MANRRPLEPLPPPSAEAATASVDPNSYTDGANPVRVHAVLTFYHDFAASTIHGSALFTLSGPHSWGPPSYTHTLTVRSTSTVSDLPVPIPFPLTATTNPVLNSVLILLPAR